MTYDIHHGVAMTGIIAHISGGRTIEAVTSYRTLYGVGLKEAKDACEAIQAALGSITPAVNAPVAEFAVFIRRDGDDYGYCRMSAVNKADAMYIANDFVKTSEDVVVVQIIAKAVTERHIKLAA